MNFLRKTIFVLCLVATGSTQSALAAPKRSPAVNLGTASDWEAHKYFEQTPRGGRIGVCTLSARAIASLPKALADRSPKAYVSRRRDTPTSAWFYELVIKTDIALLPDSKPELQIGERKFFLFAGATRSNTESEWAWVIPDNIKVVLAIMRAGATMELLSVIEDGRQVRDRFSLFGISKGLTMINKECN